MSITQAQIYWNDKGTPVSTRYDDVYFSNIDGLCETRYVFLRQNQLPNRWSRFENSRFVIAETGFGTGLNFLATWQAFHAFRHAHPDLALQELHFISVEKYPLSKDDLKKAHQHWPELLPFSKALLQQYNSVESGCHQLVLEKGAVRLELWFADVQHALPLLAKKEKRLVDAWYLDGFSPNKNPEMWRQESFEQMATLARKDCTLATFTSAGFVRRGLMQAGFSIKKCQGFGKKKEMLFGYYP